MAKGSGSKNNPTTSNGGRATRASGYGTAAGRGVQAGTAGAGHGKAYDQFDAISGNPAHSSAQGSAMVTQTTTADKIKGSTARAAARDEALANPADATPGGGYPPGYCAPEASSGNVSGTEQAKS